MSSLQCLHLLQYLQNPKPNPSMATTSIEWTQMVWNPVTGCTRASEGCDNCYAVTMTRRLEAMGQEKYAGLVNPGKKHFNGVVKCHEADLSIPLRRRKPTVYFVNSMSDLFHEGVPFTFIDKVFAVMALTPQHTFQVLTKRAERMEEYFAYSHAGLSTSMRVSHEGIAIDSERWADTKLGRQWPLPNVQLLVSVENQEQADLRIPPLLRCPAAVRGLSMEPLLSAVDLRDIIVGAGHVYPLGTGAPGGRNSGHGRIDWVIVGGESGRNARPMHPQWACALRDQCIEAGVAFFFKQWGRFGGGGVSMIDGARIIREYECFSNWVAKPQWIAGGLCLDTAGNVLEEGGDFMRARDQSLFPVAILHPLNKKESGRTLDGRTWNEMPVRKEVARGE